ncbi:hypothetical protein C8J57DRAFT_1255543 [Mycena rebaudengoi]|nr:hypothetical protein C8J57DRAFT_1255543 [Mycena rebaudengoi]
MLDNLFLPWKATNVLDYRDVGLQMQTRRYNGPIQSSDTMFAQVDEATVPEGFQHPVGNFLLVGSVQERRECLNSSVRFLSVRYKVDVGEFGWWWWWWWWWWCTRSAQKEKVIWRNTIVFDAKEEITKGVAGSRSYRKNCLEDGLVDEMENTAAVFNNLPVQVYKAHRAYQFEEGAESCWASQNRYHGDGPDRTRDRLGTHTERIYNLDDEGKEQGGTGE